MVQSITRLPDYPITRYPGLLPLFPRDVGAPRRPGIDLTRAGDLLLRVEQHLFPLRDPAGGARNSEEHREHLHRKAHRLIDQARVEIDVGVELAADEVIVFERDPLELECDVEERVLA